MFLRQLSEGCWRMLPAQNKTRDRIIVNSALLHDTEDCETVAHSGHRPTTMGRACLQGQQVPNRNPENESRGKAKHRLCIYSGLRILGASGSMQGSSRISLEAAGVSKDNFGGILCSSDFSRYPKNHEKSTFQVFPLTVFDENQWSRCRIDARSFFKNSHYTAPAAVMLQWGWGWWVLAARIEDTSGAFGQAAQCRCSGTVGIMASLCHLLKKGTSLSQFNRDNTPPHPTPKSEKTIPK